MGTVPQASLWPAWLALTVGVVDALARLGLVIRVIMRGVAVPTSLAWILLLLLLPVLSIAAYVLIGENRLGQRRAQRSEELTRRFEEQTVSLWRHRHQEWAASDLQYAHLAALGTAVSGLPPLKGNELELIADSGTMLDRLIEDIDRAERHVHLLFFIWMEGGRGVEVAEAVERAARRGVDCRILVDAVGSKQFLRGPMPERLANAGAKVVASLPVNPLRLLFARVDLRNHRKIAVIDGLVAYTGSQNITDDTFQVSDRGLRSQIGPWLEASLRIKGPTVDVLELIFLRDWMLDADEPEGKERFLREDRRTPAQGSAVHVLASGPGPHPEAIHRAMIATFHAAREEIIITTPYFVPDDATRSALITAALQGVRVTVVLPRNNDSVLVSRASKSHYRGLLEAGVRIMHHHPGLLHSKTLTIDRKLAVFGSANLDTRSFYLNFETTLWIFDDEFASVLRFMQTSYIEKSEEVPRDFWATRPRLQRFLDNSAQLLGPLL